MGFIPRQAVKRPVGSRRGVGGATLRRGGAPRWRRPLRASLGRPLIGWFVPAMRHLLSQPERGAASAVAAPAAFSWQLRQEAAWLSLRLAWRTCFIHSSSRPQAHADTHLPALCGGVDKKKNISQKNKTEVPPPPVNTLPAPSFSALLHRGGRSFFPFHGAEPMQLS